VLDADTIRLDYSSIKRPKYKLLGKVTEDWEHFSVLSDDLPNYAVAFDTALKMRESGWGRVVIIEQHAIKTLK
jgi:hypothetical protein